MGDLYLASENRYEKMTYNRVGKSGLKFPAVSLGFWHNFGSKDNYDNMKAKERGTVLHAYAALSPGSDELYA